MARKLCLLTTTRVLALTVTSNKSLTWPKKDFSVDRQTLRYSRIFNFSPPKFLRRARLLALEASKPMRSNDASLKEQKVLVQFSTESVPRNLPLVDRNVVALCMQASASSDGSSAVVVGLNCWTIYKILYINTIQNLFWYDSFY